MILIIVRVYLVCFDQHNDEFPVKIFTKTMIVVFENAIKFR